MNLKEHKLSNLKSHDDHILMQDLLPICLRGVVEKKVLSVITNLSDFFKRLCAKSLDPQEVDQLQIKVVLTLCEMEKIFPPSFFTIMIHLIIHLPAEVKLGGPIQYRWMYPIERNDGNIQKRYIFSSEGRPIGTMNLKILDMRSLAQANRYVLLHSDKLSPYRQEFLETERVVYGGIQISKHTEDKWLVEKFSTWLAKQIPKMEVEQVDANVIALARGPHKVIMLRCNWVNIKSPRSMKKDANGFVMVKVSELIHTGNRDSDDPYILASQAKQVFYVEDGKSEGWLHVIGIKPRDLFNLSVETPVEDDEYPQLLLPIVKAREMELQLKVQKKYLQLRLAAKGTKRKRGPTNMKDIWNLEPGTRIVVDANQYGQPIRMEASKFAEFLSTIARTGSICPLNTKHWKHLSKYVLENILRIVHEKFDLQGKVEDSDILSHVGKLRKEFKSTLKTRYYKEMVQEGRSIEEIYENNPPGVHDDQWKWLVDRWETSQAAAQSEKAQESRRKVRYAHTAGRTGYATLNAQFAEKEGREPSRLE
ncbi:hypothetical protein J1N35_015117 [Gossypium stocksii]|uniref:DUF4218 domain-containing protein n=1 Tax=Gossypium stocksii TaxID=47602 RepID=A0A9D4AAE4_9ROSI|nr:hypothetical protein J1N35_015117 [Gossypium stocksii]